MGVTERRRYCPTLAQVKRDVRVKRRACSLLDRDHPAGAVGSGGDHVMALGFGRARQVAGTARIVEEDLEDVARRELGEYDFRFRPAERAGHAEKIEPVRGHAVR